MGSPEARLAGGGSGLEDRVEACRLGGDSTDEESSSGGPDADNSGFTAFRKMILNYPLPIH